MLTPDFFALSERGLRTRNDDAFCAEQIGDYFVFAIADGLAGHPFGNIASTTAIEALKKTVKNTTGSPGEVLMTGVRTADTEIGVLSKRSRKHTGLATKLVACLIDEKMGCTALDVGGKNCYVITKSTIENAQDTALAQRPRGSNPVPQTVPKPPLLSDMISHTLGEPYRIKDSDFSKFTLGDEFLMLGSYGLTVVLGKEGIAKIIRKHGGSIEATCEMLVQEAMNAGSESTITVILMHGTR